MNTIPNKPKSSDAYEAGKDLWFSLPERNRSVRGVTTKLNEAGYQVSKTSIGRWAVEWAKEPNPVEQATVRLLPAPPVHADDDGFAGVPAELREVLSPRLIALSKGKGLDRVEDAVVKLAGAIAEKAPEVAALLLETETETESVTKDGDQQSNKKVEKGKAARSIVSAVATLAQAMQIISNSRALTAMSHRNFAEGDKLLAEADMYRAQARLADAEADAAVGRNRAANARDITPGTGEIDNDQEDEAVTALRDVEKAPAARQ